MLKSLARLSLTLSAVLALSPAAPAEDAALRAAEALYDGIRTETLDNGLRVYLKPVAGSPVVSVMLAYKVGSADEEKEHTGLSHYLEHLMFKGTAKLFPGDIDRITQRNGGANNAYTSQDCTVYHFDFAADRWEAALEVEADRMRNLRIDKRHEFDKEKEVVVAELEQGEDEPGDLENKAILPLLFGANHPYGHPIIGEREHVRGSTPEVIKAHYDRWYHPNNASLVVCGGFDPDRALALVKKHLGPIPRAELPRRRDASVEEPKRPARHEFESKFETARLLLGYNGPSASEPDSVLLDVVQGLLTGGKTGRLYKKLVEGEEVAVDVTASNNSGRYPGWFGVEVSLLPDKDPERVEKLVLRELKRLTDEGPTEAELRRAQRAILTESVFSRESMHDLADAIAYGVMVSDLDYLKKYLPRVMAVKAEDVQAVCRKYLKADSRVTVCSLPKKKAAVATSGTLVGRQAGRLSPRTLARKDVGAKPAEFSLKDVQRVVLDNGLVLLLLPQRRLPIVVARAAVRGVDLAEPEDKVGLAELTGALLDAGTPDRDGEEVAEQIEDVGGSLSFTSGGGSVKVLSPDRKLGLTLLFDCLTRPTFPKGVFERERDRQLADIADQEKQPESRGSHAYRALLYGNHPYGRPSLGTPESIEKLRPDDCAAFHRKVFLPNNTTVAVVGDFDVETVVEEIKKLTAGWKKGDPPPRPTPELKPLKGFEQKVVSMPDALQLHIYLGHLGVKRDNPDYHKLLVLDNVLGTGPGFTDRLSARLRDREGLAYTVSGTIASSAGEEPGLFTCYIGTAPENFAKVKKLFLEELDRIRDEAPTKDEVDSAKLYLLGNLPFRFTSNEGIAGQLLAVERYKLGPDYLDTYRKAVSAVTPEDVHAVARKYLDPARMALVAAGPIDADGKPLK